MREQPVHVRTGAGKRMAKVFTVGVLAAALVCLLFLLLRYERPYTPPEFEITAQMGVPVPPENSGYDTIEAQGLFSFAVVGAMYQQQDRSLVLYFTNPESNFVNLQCEIFNETGETLYKSGVLRPGEYVERLRPVMDFPNEAQGIQMKVYAFEPDTWYSNGSVSLSNILQAY